MRSYLDRLNWSRTLYRLLGDMKRLRKSLIQDRSRDIRRIELEVCAFGRLVSEGYIRSLGLAEFLFCCLSCMSLADYEDKLSV